MENKQGMTDARKRANAKYDKKHMGTIGIKGQREIIDRIKEYALEKGISINKLCINATMYCIDNNIDLKSIDLSSISSTDEK